MNHPFRHVCITLLCLATALPAQNEGETPKPDAKPAKVEKAEKPDKAQKDDGATAKDAAIKAIDKFIDQKNIDKKSSTWRTSLSAPPQQAFDAKSDYFWNVETSLGNVKIQLFADTAPNHVTSIIYLSRLGYYDGLKFHRIIKAFMAQGGCPLGTGSGGPGYQMAGEFNGGRKHNKAGLLSTANAGPGTDGSQFFLTFKDTDWLDGKHTLAGQTVEGLSTLKALEGVGSQDGRVANPPTMVRTWITVEPKEKAKDGESHKDGDGDKKGGEKKGPEEAGDKKGGEKKGK
ncbi:MAG: peptidylprolyl isomerase [Planctomycetota bacterium]